MRITTWCSLVLLLVGSQHSGRAAEPPAADDPFQGAVEVFRFSFESEHDLDYDGHPDDWTRRIGRSFPHFLKTEIDTTQGSEGHCSLEFQSNGGPAILYSPVMRIDPLHAYVFQGVIKTAGLKHDAAVLSLSFLNHKRERIRRLLTRPVSGTHKNWQRMRLGPISPDPETRFIVVGAHLVNGASADIQGSAWFDDLWLGQLPQLELISNFHTQFVEPGSAVKIQTKISGLDSMPPIRYPAFPLWGPGFQGAVPVRPEYRLQLHLVDSRGNVRGRHSVELSQEPEPQDEAELSPQARMVTWDLEPQDYGIYRVKAALWRDAHVIFEKQATFAVLDLVDKRVDGEFGWSFPRGTGNLPLKDLVEVSLQGGINWLKYPVWNSVDLSRGTRSAEISHFFDLLTLRRIQPVGLLNDPPAELRRKFAPNWTGISEIFNQSPKLWSPWLDPVLAKYSSTVQYWQLGDDSDQSFVGMPDLEATLSSIKREFDLIGRDTRIGVHWDPKTALPADQGLSRAFFSIDQMSSPKLTPADAGAPPTAYARWVLLKPLARSQYTPEERGADLLKRMVAAKLTKADAIFARNVLDEEHGLLNPDGSPTLLFLPWRNTALALQGSHYLGSLELQGGSKNFLFEREGRDDAVMFVWNDEPTVETILLGDSSTVKAINLWGEQTRFAVDPETGQQKLPVGSMPLVIRGCSKSLARWRLAMQFETGRLASATGVHLEHLIGRNTFEQGVSGTVTIHTPAEWEIEPRTFPIQVGRGEKFRLPAQITLPPHATLGTELIPIDVDLDADRKYRIRLYRPLEIGLGDVELNVVDRRLDNDILEIEQTLINKTAPAELLNFECSLFIPGSKRQKKLITKQGPGESVKFYYAPGADNLKGKELWLRAEQLGGRRVLNYRWVVGKEWVNPLPNK